MIVVIFPSGKSFKGLSEYLTHDPKAKTDERVDWTHTLNLANDHVGSGVNEMYLTAENAQLLKQQSGIRAGGRKTGSPVKHISLNWAPDDSPSRDHMIETGEAFLRQMKWHEHQAILIAHSDKPHRHVHIMLSVVHPETGLRASDSFEQRRAQEWALGYERDQGVIRCPERPKNVREREPNIPRNMWMHFQGKQREFENREKLGPENIENGKDAEWKILKDFQRRERDAFYADGKIEFRKLRSDVYREVKAEYREQWSNYYKEFEKGSEAERAALADVKAKLVADQKATLEHRRDARCFVLFLTRDEQKTELLQHQKEVRAELRSLQKAGLDPAPFLSSLEMRKNATLGVTDGFRGAAGEISAKLRAPGAEHVPPGREATENGGHSSRNRSTDPIRKPARLAGSLLDALFFDLTNLGSAAPKPVSDDDREVSFREAAENATKQQQQRARDAEDDRWRVRQKELYRE